MYKFAYGLFACNSILFSHESPVRPPRFITRKIVQAAVRLSKDSQVKLILGDMRIQRVGAGVLNILMPCGECYRPTAPRISLMPLAIEFT